MKALIVEDPYNSNAQDWRRTFNDIDSSIWVLIPAAVVTQVPIPAGTEILEISGGNNITLSAAPITDIPEVGSPTLGQFFLNAPVIVVEEETILYVFAREEMDLVVNFYKAR